MKHEVYKQDRRARILFFCAIYLGAIVFFWSSFFFEPENDILNSLFLGCSIATFPFVIFAYIKFDELVGNIQVIKMTEKIFFILPLIFLPLSIILAVGLYYVWMFI